MSAAIDEPPWMTIARGELGVKGSSPRVAEYLATVDVKPPNNWCAGFARWVLEQADIPCAATAAARSFLKWGRPIEEPVPGCVVVFWRESKASWKGHVGFLIEAGPRKLKVLGGNQAPGSQVSITQYDRSRLLGLRMP